MNDSAHDSNGGTGPLRLGVLLSGGGRTLLNMLEEIAAGRLDAEVVIVIASRDCKGVQRAQAARLQVFVVPYKQMPDLATYSARLCELLDAAEVDLVCLAGFLSFWEIPPRYEGRVMPVLEGDTPDELAARVFEQECKAYPEAIRLFAEGRLRIEGHVVHVD